MSPNVFTVLKKVNLLSIDKSRSDSTNLVSCNENDNIIDDDDNDDCDFSDAQSTQAANMSMKRAATNLLLKTLRLFQSFKVGES